MTIVPYAVAVLLDRRLVRCELYVAPVAPYPLAPGTVAYVVPVTENVLLSCENEKAANPILRVSVAGSPKFAVPPAKLVE